MAVLIAYIVAIAAVPVFLFVDWLGNGMLVGILYSPVPFNLFSWVPATIIYIATIYFVSWLGLEYFRKSVHGLVEAGQPPAWAEEFRRYDQLIRWDYGHWTIILAAIAAIVSVVSLPALHAHLVSPISWTLIALASPTLAKIYTERDTPPPLESSEAAGRQRASRSQKIGITPDEALTQLKQSPAYRGQLRAEIRSTAKHAQFAHPINGATDGRDPLEPGSLLDAVLSGLGIAGREKLFAHQQDALNSLFGFDSDKGIEHVILTTGPGTGRETIMFLAMIERTLLRGSHVLVISPNDREAEQAQERFQKIATVTGWQYALFNERISVSDLHRPVPDPPPEILFCSLRSLHEVLLRENRSWLSFFDGLDLVIAEDIDQYTGIRGANATAVFRRLSLVAASHQQRIQILSTSRPAQNIRSFTIELFGLSTVRDQVKTVQIDDSDRPEQIFGVWLPSMEVVVSSGKHLTRRTRRQGQVDAATELVLLLAHTSDDYRVLVYGNTWEAIDLEELSERVNLQTGGSASHRISILKEESTLGALLPSYDALIILGSPKGSQLMYRLAGPLGRGRGGGLCLVLGDHSPITLDLVDEALAVAIGSQETSRYQESQLPTILPIFPSHQQILEKHLSCAVLETSLTSEGALSCFGEGIRTVLESLSSPAESQRKEIPGYAVSAEEPLHLNSPIDAVYERCVLDAIDADDLLVVMTPQREPIGHVDSYRLAAELFPGKRIEVSDQPFEIQFQMTEPLEVMAVAADARTVAVIPQYEVEASLVADRRKSYGRPMRLAGSDELVMYVEELDVCQSLHSVTMGQRTEEFAPSINANFTTPVAIFTSLDERQPLSMPIANTVARLLAQTLKKVLPASYPRSTFRVAVLPSIDGLTGEPSIVVYETVNQTLGLVDIVTDHADDLIHCAYLTLATCPCREGCPGCLDPRALDLIVSGDGRDTSIDKRASLEFLGTQLRSGTQVLDGRNYRELIDLRYDRVEDIDNLLGLRYRILELGFYPLLEIDQATFAAPPVRFMTSEEAARSELAGFTLAKSDGSKEIVVRRAREEQVVAALTHQNGHHWERYSIDGRSNLHASLLDAETIPYSGRLFSEGLAQWFEFRIRDAYGYVDEEGEYHFSSFDRFPEGFQVIQHLETRHGVSGMLSLLREGIPSEQLVELLREAGIDSYLSDRERFQGSEHSAAYVDQDLLIEDGTDVVRLTAVETDATEEPSDSKEFEERFVSGDEQTLTDSTSESGGDEQEIQQGVEDSGDDDNSMLGDETTESEAHLDDEECDQDEGE